MFDSFSITPLDQGDSLVLRHLKAGFSLHLTIGYLITCTIRWQQASDLQAVPKEEQSCFWGGYEEEDNVTVTLYWPENISREFRRVKVAHVSLLFFFPGIWRSTLAQEDGGVGFCATHRATGGT